MENYTYNIRNLVRTFRKDSGLFISLIVIFLLILYRFQNGIIQQDNYVGYAKSLENGLKDLSYFDSRLFPGLPILIYIFEKITFNYYAAGYLVVLFSFIGAYVLLNRITNSKANILPLIFPPIMLGIATLIASEYLTIFLILLTSYLFLNRRYSLAAFTSGINILFRPAGSLLFIAMIVALYFHSRKDLKIKYFIYFSMPISFLMLYNKIFFNSLSPFYQLITYKNVSPYGNAIGFIGVLNDLVRAYKWHQYDILISGMFYLTFFSCYLQVVLEKYKKQKDMNTLFLILSILLFSFFVLSYSFMPYLENFARYLAPTIPLFWILENKSISKNVYIYIGLVLSLLVVVH